MCLILIILLPFSSKILKKRACIINRFFPETQNNIVKKERSIFKKGCLKNLFQDSKASKPNDTRIQIEDVLANDSVKKVVNTSVNEAVNCTIKDAVSKAIKNAVNISVLEAVNASVKEAVLNSVQDGFSSPIQEPTSESEVHNIKSKSDAAINFISAEVEVPCTSASMIEKQSKATISDENQDSDDDLFAGSDFV